MSRWSLRPWALVAIMVAAVVGCSPSSKSGGSKKIKIMSSLPRTGSAKGQTDTIVNGIKMALEEVNYRVGDFEIEYLDRDDATAAAGQWTAEAETTNAKEAAGDPDVLVYIGTYNSGAAKISMPILNQAGLLMISPANTTAGLTKPDMGESDEPGRYRPTGKINYCRVVPADDLQGSLSADWAQKLGMKKVFVLDDTEIYGRGVANMFEERCNKLGIEVLGHESIDAKQAEFRTLMTKIKGLDPDLVYFGGTSQQKGPQVAKDLVAVGMDCPLMVPDGCMEQAFIDGAGAENVNGRCYVTFGGLPPEALTGAGAEFVKKYQEKFGGAPEAYAVYGYESAKVALEAIRTAKKKDRASIVEACLSIRDFKGGALGEWSFDENGDTTSRTLSGNVIRDGKFVFETVLQ